MEGESSSARNSNSVSLEANDGFTNEKTLFLIDLMRQHLESNGSELPQSLAELKASIKTSKGSKKQMWRDMASKLFDHFS